MSKINLNGMKNFFKKRNFKYGTNAVILIAAVIAIAIIVNLLVGLADLKLDLTPNKLYSLSDTTKKELENLRQDVEIIGLFDDAKISSENKYKEVTDLLNLYAKYPHVKVRYVDPDRNPSIINELDPDGTMDLGSTDFVVKSVVNGVEKKKKLEYYDLFNVKYNQYTFEPTITGSNAEQGFTGAIRYVTSEETPVVYFTEGHNEINVDLDYSVVKEYLEKNNFMVKKINLLSVDKIPDDAELVIIASPKSDISFKEREVLDDYLYNGGKAVFMFDYLANDPSFDEFNNLFSKYNVAINYDRVIETDESRHLPNNPNIILLNVYANKIIPNKFLTLLENSRSVSILKNKKDYITITPLMSTSANAIGEMVDKSRGEDQKGPLDIAVAVEYNGGAKPSKIVVIGNASFISDDMADSYGNYYLNSIQFFLQTINWMIDKKDDVIVPTKNYDVNTINISQKQASIMGIMLVVVFPVLILGTGMVVYLRRRHL